MTTAAEGDRDLPRLAMVRHVLAAVGLNLAYMPLLVLLLPRRIEQLFGEDAAAVLSWALLAGALAASFGNILAGRIGDGWLRRHGSRRGLIALGLVGLLATYPLLAFATGLAGLIAAVVAFQLGLNLAFSPVMALLADHVPDDRKGGVAGWLAAATPLSILGTAAIGVVFPADDNMAFLALAVLVTALVLPLVLGWGLPAARPCSGVSAGAAGGPVQPVGPVPVSRLALLWSARFLVQLSASFVLYYVFLYASDLVAQDPAWAGRNPSSDIALFSFLGALAAIVGATGSGIVSDRLGRRRLPLVVAALLLAAALFLLAAGPSPLVAAIAFTLFQLALAVYLGIDTAWVARLVAPHPARGAMLGLMNLTNTLPSIIAPLMALQALGAGESGAAMLEMVYGACALAALVAALVAGSVRPGS